MQRRGTLRSDINSILGGTNKVFFKELFTSEGINVTEADSLLNTVDAKLTDDENAFCEKAVSLEEIHKVIKLLNPRVMTV